MGSHASVVAPQQALELQHGAAVAPSLTRSAAWPYFSFTADLRVESEVPKADTASPRATNGPRLHAGDQGLYLFECLGIELVVNPPPVLPVVDDSSILENAEMERKTRLSSVQSIGQLADAPLSFAEQLDDLESGLVGEGVKQLDRALSSGVGCPGHKVNISK